MFQLYSKGCAYAIRALVQFNPAALEQSYPAREICKKARIPESFTRKVFQALVKGYFLKAVPGPGGGYRLNGNPSHIRLADVITAVDGKDAFERCVLGEPRCSDEIDCVLHQTWTKTKKSVIEELHAKTLMDLIGEAQIRGKKTVMTRKKWDSKRKNGHA